MKLKSHSSFLFLPYDIVISFHSQSYNIKCTSEGYDAVPKLIVFTTFPLGRRGGRAPLIISIFNVYMYM